VIRRDNIGDLVCTTPLFSALRKRFPEARITALVNSYNAPALSGNPEVDEVCIYQKAKHRESGESKLAIWLRTWRMVLRLRRTRFDLCIVATPGRQASALRFAHWVSAKRLIACDETASSPPLSARQVPVVHETEAVMRLLLPLGIDEAPGPVRVYPNASLVAAIALPQGNGPLVGLHISARKPAQRWSAENFSSLAQALHVSHGARFMLFWSPGAEDHPRHPGDDGKAQRIVSLCAELPLCPCPTERLEELIAGLACCDMVICSDGGAMHVAAGLGKPIVCFFGNSNARRWRPWGVPYELLQPDNHDVTSIPVADAIAAYERLLDQVVSAQTRARAENSFESSSHQGG
jgi:ADP-heptose:LPS heptosyltransferase